MKKIPILFMALAIPLGVFAQAPQNPQTYIINVGGKNFEIMGSPPDSLQPTVMDGITVYVQKPPAVSAPVKILDPGALPTASAGVTPSREDRSRLTLPVPPRVLPPRQSLPPDRTEALIPRQYPAPTNLQPVTCQYSSGPRGGTYTCKFMDPSTGRSFTRDITEFASVFHNGFSLPNIEYVAIHTFHQTYYKDRNGYFAVVPNVPIDMITLRPAPVPIFYPGKLLTQLNNGKPWNSLTLEKNKTVLMGDGKTPLPEDFFRMLPSRAPNDRVPDAPGTMMFLLGDWAKKGYLKDGDKALRVANLPIFVPMSFSPPQRPVLVPWGNGGYDPLGKITQGNPNPGRLPAQSAPTGGFGQPTGNGGGSLTGGGVFGNFTDWWSQQGILGNVTWSFYVEIPIFKWGNGPSGVPPPGFTPDGKAYNMYFSLNGAAFALSFTDLNNDGIYEAHILELEGNPENPNLGRIKDEFDNYDEFNREMARRLTLLSTPAKK